MKKRRRRPQRIADPTVRRSELVEALQNVRQRLDTTAREAIDEAARQALAQGQVINKEAAFQQATTQHNSMLVVICEEMGVAPSEIGLEVQDAPKHPESGVLLPA